MGSYNSIIYGNFLQPITCAVYYLVRRDRDSVDWKTNENDLDWILSGTLMTVTMLECALRWTHLHRRKDSKNEGEYLYNEILAEHESELPDVSELFLLRHAIAHGHAWCIGIPESPGISASATLVSAKPTKKHGYYVNEFTQQTRSGLNVIPTRMNRQDFKRVLEITVEAFAGLIKLNCLLPQALDNAAKWPDGSGKRVTLGELPARI